MYQFQFQRSGVLKTLIFSTVLCTKFNIQQLLNISSLKALRILSFNKLGYVLWGILVINFF